MPEVAGSNPVSREFLIGICDLNGINHCECPFIFPNRIRFYVSSGHSPYIFFKSSPTTKFFFNLIFIFIGSLIAAFAIEVFLKPNELYDGGTIGLSMILNRLFFQDRRLQYLVAVLTSPFVWLAYRSIGRQFVVRMFAAIVFFCFGLTLFERLIEQGYLLPYSSDMFTIIIIGGIILGVGVGMIIRSGGGMDGSEIVAIIANQRFGYTVGQVILAFNVVIFALAGVVQRDWNTAVHSLLIYVVAYKMIDLVIQGFDETKSVMVISEFSRKISDAISREMGVGHTIMYGRGGFSGNNKEILYVIIERLQLVELKAIVQREDHNAFIAIHDLHEIVHGQVTHQSTHV